MGSGLNTSDTGDQRHCEKRYGTSKRQAQHRGERRLEDGWLAAGVAGKFGGGKYLVDVGRSEGLYVRREKSLQRAIDRHDVPGELNSPRFKGDNQSQVPGQKRAGMQLGKTDTAVSSTPSGKV